MGPALFFLWRGAKLWSWYLFAGCQDHPYRGMETWLSTGFRLLELEWSAHSLIEMALDREDQLNNWTSSKNYNTIMRLWNCIVGWSCSLPGAKSRLSNGNTTRSLKSAFCTAHLQPAHLQGGLTTHFPWLAWVFWGKTCISTGGSCLVTDGSKCSEQISRCSCKPYRKAIMRGHRSQAMEVSKRYWDLFFVHSITPRQMLPIHARWSWSVATISYAPWTTLTICLPTFPKHAPVHFRLSQSQWAITACYTLDSLVFGPARFSTSVYMIFKYMEHIPRW